MIVKLNKKIIMKEKNINLKTNLNIFIFSKITDKTNHNYLNLHYLLESAGIFTVSLL